MPILASDPAPGSLAEVYRNVLQDAGGGYPDDGLLRNILIKLGQVLHNSALGTFGDGLDGTQVFDGTTTILGLAPSSSVYTLTRDIFLSDLSAINAGVTVVTAGFRIFCAGRFVFNGTISWNGNAAVANTAGAALSGAGTTINTATTTGAAGAAGNATTVGTAGNAQAARSLGGASGAGGAGAGPTAGGAAGAVTAPTSAMTPPRALPLAALGFVSIGAATFNTVFGGAGGGAGGSDATNMSGGGGSGGGVVIVVALAISGTGTIEALGGAGGAASATGNSGGGGGGGGGVVIVVSRSVQSPAQTGVSTPALPGLTVSAAGGAGGAKTGTGVAGAAGSAGTVIMVPA